MKENNNQTFCNLCSVAFLSSADLNNHYTTEHESDEESGSKGNGYGCGDCSRQFSCFQELCDHMETQHSESLEDDIQCLGSFNNNLKTQVTSDSDGDVICIDFDSESDLNVSNEPKSDTQSVTGNNSNDSNVIQNTKGFFCHLCNRQFEKNAHLKNHNIIHTGPVCSTCNSCFKNPVEHSRHIQYPPKPCKHVGQAICIIESSNQSSLHCRFCQAHFRSIFDLQLHSKRVHGNDIDLKCPFCETKQMFKYKAKFARHIISMHSSAKQKDNKVDINADFGFKCSPKMNSHTDLEPENKTQGNENDCKRSVAKLKESNTSMNEISTYYCEICKCNFNSKMSLISHTKNHTGHVCPRCKCCFKRPEKLEMHIMKPPETCNEANRVRMFLSNLDKNKDCMSCNQKFDNSYDLQHHEFREHGIKPVYKCGLCDTHKNNDNVTRQHYCMHIDRSHIRKREPEDFHPTKKMKLLPTLEKCSEAPLRNS